MLYHSHKQILPDFKIVLNKIEIPRVRSAKFLGTWIDDYLNWEVHTNKVLMKLKCGIRMLRHSKYLLTSKAKCLLYFGQIHSHLCYCLCIWGSMLQKHLVDKLLKAQHTAVSLIDPNNTIDETFKKYKILKLTDMINLEQCKMGYKLCHNLLPNKLVNSMTQDHKCQSIVKKHRYFTRSKRTPNLPSALGIKYRSSFLYNSIREYSALENSLKHSKTYTCL